MVFLIRRLFPSFLNCNYQCVLHAVIIYPTLFSIVVLECYICHIQPMSVMYLSVTVYAMTKIEISACMFCVILIFNVFCIYILCIFVLCFTFYIK